MRNLQTSGRIITYDIKILISDQADGDIRNICEYIAFELQSPENAGVQLDRLEESIIGLEQMPDRFREYEIEPWNSLPPDFN